MHFYIAWTVVDRFWYRKLVGKWGVWLSHYLIHFGNSAKDLLPWCSGCHLPKCCSLTCDVNKMMIFNMLSVQVSKVIMLIKKKGFFWFKMSSFILLLDSPWQQSRRAIVMAHRCWHFMLTNTVKMNRNL